MMMRFLDPSSLSLLLSISDSLLLTRSFIEPRAFGINLSEPTVHNPDDKYVTIKIESGEKSALDIEGHSFPTHTYVIPCPPIWPPRNAFRTASSPDISFSVSQETAHDVLNGAPTNMDELNTLNTLRKILTHKFFQSDKQKKLKINYNTYMDAVNKWLTKKKVKYTK